MSIARAVTTNLTSTISKGSRTLQVGYVKKTDIWTRTFLDSGVEAEFKAAAEKHIDSYHSDTTAVALQ